MWAREWFETVRNIVIHREFMRERIERMRASIEGGAVRYDGVPGGGRLSDSLVKAAGGLLAYCPHCGARMVKR